uniref:Uncharacterized protein n=1 Tax=Glycine max TaxID=3847 RepID=A0A0R0GPP0_SOYBN
MVVLKSTSPLSSLTSHFFNLSSSSSSSSKFTSPHSLRRRHFHHVHSTSRVAQFTIRAYMENPNTLGSFANRVIGALPVVGLIARILSDEGGVGDDLVDFAEFRRRVGKKCSETDSTAFYEFQDRRGKAGDPLYVLLCCWLAAIGAGLLKTEDILEGVARLRISNDIEFEEQSFMALMNESKEESSTSESINWVVRKRLRECLDRRTEGMFLLFINLQKYKGKTEKPSSLSQGHLFNKQAQC